MAGNGMDLAIIAWGLAVLTFDKAQDIILKI
jgi:hypothetical protein